MKKRLIHRFILWLTILLATLQLSAQSYSYRLKIPYRDGAAWGYCDTLGQVLHPAQYDSLGFFNFMHPVAVYKQDGKYGLVDSGFTATLPAQYEALSILNHNAPKHNEILKVKSNNLVGFVSMSGDILIAIAYDSIRLFNDFIVVRKDAKYGVFSKDFKRLAAIQYDNYYISFDGVAPFSLLVLQKDSTFSQLLPDGSIGPLDASRLPQKDAQISALFGGGSRQAVTCLSKEAVQTKIRQGEINLRPALIQFDRLVDNNERGHYYRLLIKDIKGYALFDLQRGELINRYYEDIVKVLRFSGDRELWCVKENGKYGIVHGEEATTVLPFDYDGFGEIQRTHIITIKAGLKGVYIPFTTYPPIPCVYNDIYLAKYLRVSSNWSFGVFAINKSEKPGYIGENGVEYFR